jgi:hypothetical protein
MKTKRFFLFGLPVLLLAWGLVLVGCGSDDDDGGDDGINLPGITEETTGRATITGSNITVSGAGMPQELAEQTDYNGAKFSITGGKFSFTLPQSPTNLEAFGAENKNLLDELLGLGGSSSSGENSEGFVTVRRFSWSEDNTYYWIQREAYETDEKTYMDSSEITYVYVSKDVTLSCAAGEDTDTDGDETYIIRWGAVNFALKTGWNLVQTNSHGTQSGNTYTETVTVKIADKDVPWMFDTHSGGGGGN